MTAAKLSSQDRKDLDKFTRFLAYKIVQVVVQSRLGVKIKTESKPHSSSADWFNLSIQDLPEVQSESKRALDGQIPTIGLGMCVEISLKTMEGDTMVLETWYLEMTDQCDPGVRVTYTVYNRMSTMLKSLLVMTRVTPAYKLSQLQGSTTFVICYRVYMGEPQYNNLGDNYSRGKVGQVGTPVGTLMLSVAYRTQMTISPQKANKDGVFMVKSDHFNPEMSPKCPHRPCGPNHNVIQVTDQKSVMDELASACEDCQDDNYRCPMVMNNCHQNNPSCVNGSVKKVPSPVLRNGDACPINIAERQVSFSECMKVGAFVDRVRENGQCDNGDYIMPDPPFANLLKTMANAEKTVSHLNSLNKQSSNGKLSSANCEKQDNNYIETEDLQRSRTMVTSGVDDFVMVDLKPPFACGDEATDLGAFFRECQTAPQLLSFNEQPSFAEQVNELGIQLAKFETSVPDFDDFVETLCLDETSK